MARNMVQYLHQLDPEFPIDEYHNVVPRSYKLVYNPHQL